MNGKGSPPSRHRVVQWATGDIGIRALREVSRYPSLDLVGVLVYDAAREGRLFSLDHAEDAPWGTALGHGEHENGRATMRGAAR